MQSTERWLPVVGFEGMYEVSDLGRVRSLPGDHRGAKILKPYPTVKGALYVGLRIPNVKRVPRAVHVMVLEAFVCPRPAGLIGLHYDDDHQNNTVSKPAMGNV